MHSRGLGWRLAGGWGACGLPQAQRAPGGAAHGGPWAQWAVLVVLVVLLGLPRLPGQVALLGLVGAARLARRSVWWGWPVLLALAWPAPHALAQGGAPAPTGATAPAPAPASAPNYRFRLPAAATPVRPAHDLLDAEERRFLAGLPTLRVGLNLPDNRPYEVIGPDGRISGIQIELLTHLALALGLKVEPVVFGSFSEAWTALREQRVDLMATLGYDVERDGQVAFTLGTSPNPGAVIMRAGAPPWQATSTLDGRRVAIERGYVAQWHVRRTWPRAQLLEQTDTAAALRAVASGQADAYVGSLLMAMDRIQREALPGLQVSNTLVYGTGQMHFGVRRDWPLLASALNKGIAALRAAPLPGTRAALQAVSDQRGGASLPQPMALSPPEQRALVRRSVLRVGAVRGLLLLNEATAGGGHAGIASDYTQQVLGRLGVAHTVVPFDSVAQMLDALRAGRLDLVPLLSHTPGRAQQLHYSEPYLSMPYHIVARSDAPLYWGLDSLRGKRLALAPQHPLRERLAQDFPDIQVVQATPGQGAMDLVAAGLADAAVEVKLFANLRIHQDPGARLRTVSQVDELSAQFHWAAGPHTADLVPLINRALADIGPDERARILRRWVAIDYTPGVDWPRLAPWLLAIGLGLAGLAGASAWWMRRLALEVRSRRLAEDRLNGLVASLPGIVFQFVAGGDGADGIRYLSPTAEQFLDAPELRRVGLFTTLARRLSRADAATLRAERRRSLAERQPFKQTLRCVAPDGAERWLHCEAAVHTLSDGRTAWTGYLVDVSGEHALQARLLDALQTKNLFVASASHELRAPLQVVSLALAQLGQGPLEPRQRGLCRIAQDSAGALLALVDDLLDLARLESGRLVLHPAPVHLPTLLAQVVANHRLVADARGLNLRLQLGLDLPGPVLVDGLRLRQLLVNLIGNALKYTAQGEVVLSAGVAPGPVPDGAGASADAGGALVVAGGAVDGAEAGAGAPGAPPPSATAPAAGPVQHLRLVVRDTGQGIAPERLPHLFEPFGDHHVPGRAAAPAEPSTGLGLAICKRLVEAMGGQIRLRSRPGQGTEVTLALPWPPAANLAASAAPLAGDAGTAPPVDLGPPGTVLVVDDDPVTRLLIGETLRRAGHAVDEAANATQALARCQAGGVRLVISDHHMPGGDGLGLLQRLVREMPTAERPLLVLCSASESPPPEALRGIDAVLRKPVAGERLTQLVGALLACRVGAASVS